MTALKKTLTAAAAALTLAVAFAPAAEARYHRHGWLAAGLVGGALIGSAFAARGHYAPVGAYEYGPECYRVRERVWDEYRGRFVRVTRTQCD